MLDPIEQKMRPFYAWSPNQLAFAVGMRINLVGDSPGDRTAYIVRNGKATMVSHTKACLLLSRLARLRGVRPGLPPAAPRALINGEEQAHV